MYPAVNAVGARFIASDTRGTKPRYVTTRCRGESRIRPDDCHQPDLGDHKDRPYERTFRQRGNPRSQMHTFDIAICRQGAASSAHTWILAFAGMTVYRGAGHFLPGDLGVSPNFPPKSPFRKGGLRGIRHTGHG